MISIHNQIECDLHNIQQMVELLPLCVTKSERRTLESVIKVLVKEIHNQRCEIEQKMFCNIDKIAIPLFEVEPSPIDIKEQYKEMTSFFGELDALDCEK